MTYNHKLTLPELLDAVRPLIPKRPLSYGESLFFAKRQAERTRELLGVPTADINLRWLFEQKKYLDIERLPAYRMADRSGATTKVRGKYVIWLNRSEPKI